MGNNVVGYLELMIQNIKAENEELKKKNNELTAWGEAILASYKQVVDENEQMQLFIDKVMQRVKEGEGGEQIRTEETKASEEADLK